MAQVNRCDECGKTEERSREDYLALQPLGWYRVSRRPVKGGGMKEQELCSPGCVVTWAAKFATPDDLAPEDNQKGAADLQRLSDR